MRTVSRPAYRRPIARKLPAKLRREGVCAPLVRKLHAADKRYASPTWCCSCGAEGHAANALAAATKHADRAHERGHVMTEHNGTRVVKQVHLTWVLGNDIDSPSL
jgi:hypothetical protein